MKTRANLTRVSLAGLGVVLCFADFVSAADSSKNVNTYTQTTGGVTGKLTGTFGNQVVYGFGETVRLTPSSGGRAIKTKTNAEGRFLFQNVPPGQYELRTRFEWTTTYIECDEDGIPDRMYVDHSRELVGRVQVKPHQTARVTTYTVGPTHNAFYAYGGNLSKPHHPLASDD